MAKAKNTESQTAETEIQPENEAPQQPVPPAAATGEKKLVCVAGFNHAAIHSGDTLEIPVAGLPASFTLDGVTEGYFPGQFVKRFNVASHARDGKTLKIKITPQV